MDNLVKFGLVWFGLVWLGMVWFGFEWYGVWVLYRWSNLKNLTLGVREATSDSESCV